jgi:hypothetical protein
MKQTVYLEDYYNWKFNDDFSIIRSKYCFGYIAGKQIRAIDLEDNQFRVYFSNDFKDHALLHNKTLVAIQY